jgi:hypothetical protein
MPQILVHTVDPVIAGKLLLDDAGSEGTGRVQAGASEVDTDHVAEEKCGTDSQWGKEGSAVLAKM